MSFSELIRTCKALGIATCVISGQSNADFYAGISSQIALSYACTSMGVNIICSVLICARILWIARRIQATLGDKVSREYTGAMAIIIESMLPYTVFAIAYMATLGSGSPLVTFFISPYVMLSVSVHFYYDTVACNRGAEPRLRAITPVHLPPAYNPPRSDGAWAQ